MKAHELLNEKASRGRPIIAVDIQPEYAAKYKDVMRDSIQFVNNSHAPCLMFVNAEQDGLSSDTVDDIKMMWEDNGFDPKNWNRVEVYDKGYGYFRAWMDIGVEDKYIIAMIREMYKQGINDSRQLFRGGSALSNHKIHDFLEPIADSVNTEPQYLDEDPIIVGWAALDQLKRYNNSYLIGGARNECLKEVALLMNAFNIKYKKIDNLIYGYQ